MSSSLQTIDTDVITLRRIYARTSFNAYIPSSHILIANGRGLAYWNSVSSIFPISSFNAVRANNGYTFYADQFNNILNVSTTGIRGLLDTYVDSNTSTLMLSNSAPPVAVALTTVPNVSRLAAELVPNAQILNFSTGQSTLKFIGVGALQLSTVTDLRAVFFSISTFSAGGYADLSAEARAWRPYAYSTNSTSAGYATFVSSVPFTASLGSDIPVSTVEQYASDYPTGDFYFSSVSVNMQPFYRYLQPNSTTRVLLEVRPNYFFDRLYRGTSSPYSLIKPVSSYVQYNGISTGRTIFPASATTDYMTSQSSNLYESNYYQGPLMLQLDTPMLMSNLLIDGPTGYLTLYHRFPGGMAQLMDDPDCGCDKVIGGRGGFSNPAMVYDNRTAAQNSVFLHVYNQQGAAAPLPGP